MAEKQIQSHPVNPAPRRRRINRAKRFRKRLLIYSAVFLFIGFVGLFVFSRYLSAYEQGRGEHAVSAWMEGKSEEDYRALMLSGPILTLSEFETNDAIINAYFDASCAGKSFSYREAAGVSTAERPVFTIKAGAADVGRLTLRRGKSVGFGFHSWVVDSAEPYISPYALSSVKIALEVMAGEPYYLNGVAIGEQYITDGDISVSALSPLESRYADKPHLVRYEIPGLYGKLTVTDARGNEIPATEENGMPVYRPGGKGGYGFVITVPAGSTVTVCGTALTDAELTEKGMNPLEGLERFLGEGCSAAQLTYAAFGLFRQPDIQVVPPAGMTVIRSDGENGSIVYTPAPDEALKAQHLDMVKSFFDDNMNYSAGNNAYLQNLLLKTLYGTELYNYFSNSTAAMIWASDTKISYDYLNFDNFVSRGENCFTCTVSYKASLSSQQWYTTTESQLEDSYILTFVRYMDVWYAAAMSLIE